MFFYVIMPIGADPDYQQKMKIIKASSLNSGVAVHFPDYCPTKPEFDLQSTLRDLELSNFVLADLSQERPSCYYELGIAQAIGKNIYIVAVEGTPIHQAHGRDHVIYYKNLKELGTLVSGILDSELRKKANK